MEKKKIVLPGEFLSTEEEFAAGRNTFDSDDGNVYSKGIGSVEHNNQTKEVSVKPAVDWQGIRRGGIVLGRVELVKDSSVLVTLMLEPGNPKKQILVPGSAMIPIRNVSRDYVERLKDVFKVGDIVRARVAKIMPGPTVDLETNQPDLGVVKAFCSHCRKPLHQFGPNLKCMVCGSTESRKLARAYLTK